MQLLSGCYGAGATRVHALDRTRTLERNTYVRNSVLRVRDRGIEQTMSVQAVLDRRTKANCFLCNSYAGSTFADVRHIGYVHAHEPNFTVVCGIRDCSRSYTNYCSYKRHLYREHRDYLDLNNPETNPAQVSLRPGSTNVAY